MKTAMQNLKIHIQDMVDNGGDMDLLCVLGMIDKTFLESEKQQILTANNRGYKVGRKDIAETANEYYQDTYGSTS